MSNNRSIDLDLSSIQEESDESCANELNLSFNEKDKQIFSEEVKKELMHEEKTNAYHETIGLFSQPAASLKPLKDIPVKTEEKEPEVLLDCHCFGFYNCSVL